ncbi:MAG: DNA polymerase I [Planctomycetota bacterium]|nr:DNA polymerase I [Planctomycetota bacterium]
MSDRPRLFLFDGSALAYRSHFAFIKNPLRNSRGLNTSAAYGFTRDLLRILDQEEPDRVAVVFDVSKRTFRHAKYEAYKATRARMPDDLVDALPYVDRIVDALGLPRLGLEGYEADDVVATLAKKAEAQGYDVLIVTGDKDFCQLVTERIHLYNPWRQNLPPRVLAEEVDPAGCAERYGLPPERFRDYLALVGDSSDNVPGVPGVGPKRALELLQQFGDLDALLARAEEVRLPSIRKALLDHRESALLSRDLVTLDMAAPVPTEPDALVRRDPDRPELARLFAELEFRELLRRFSTDKRDDPHVHHRVGPDELDGLVARLREAPEFVFDLETTSLDPQEAEVVGMAFSFREGEAWYVGAEEHALHAAAPAAASAGEQFDLFAPPPAPQAELFPLELDFSRHLERLRPVLEDPTRAKGGQNVKYDALVLARHGIEVKGIAFDTLLESYLLDPSQKTHNLDDLALRFLGYRKIATSEVIGRGKGKRTMKDAPDRDIFPYCSEDADITFRLHRLFTRRLEQEPGLVKLYREVELPLMDVLRRMEETGVRVDPEVLGRIGHDLRRRLKGFEEEIGALAGGDFNMSSPKQVAALLFDRLELHKAAGLRIKRTATGAASTDAEVLEQLAPHHPLPAKILEHRALEKLIGTYVDALLGLISPRTGRVHTSFNQAVAATGRLSSSDPNLQNIPIRTPEGKQLRSAFVAGEPGWQLLSADYSQVELRILAHLSGDETLLDAFRRGLDVHRATAARIFDVPLDDVTPELRGRAKAINFGIVYGMGAQRLARDTGLSVADARAFIDGYFAKYPRIKGYLDAQVEHARQHGYVETVLGRRRPLGDIHSTQRQLRANAERMATNTPIQGSAADIIKVAMVRIDRRLRAERLAARMLLQVHDELLFEAPPHELDRLEALVKEEMTGAFPMTVPLVVDVGRGRSWFEAH